MIFYILLSSFLRQLRIEYNLCVTEWFCGEPGTPSHQEATRFMQIHDRNVRHS